MRGEGGYHLLQTTTDCDALMRPLLKTAVSVLTIEAYRGPLVYVAAESCTTEGLLKCAHLDWVEQEGTFTLLEAHQDVHHDSCQSCGRHLDHSTLGRHLV